MFLNLKKRGKMGVIKDFVDGIIGVGDSTKDISSKNPFSNAKIRIKRKI